MAQDDRINVVVLGSTGSVGTQTLDVIRAAPDDYRVVGLAGNLQCEELAAQAREFGPECVAVGEAGAAGGLCRALDGLDVELLAGPEGLCRLASWESADVVLSAISGAAGLPAAMAALESGKRLALANKEPIVMCGRLLTEMARDGDGMILPVDSEHSGIFQLMQGVDRDQVARVILTASGGPFLGRSPEELAEVTPEQTLRHPTWRMGPKITIDSATLMNKALEIIEAHWLFDIEPERIGVLLHPQSVIHAMLELADGSFMAQMAPPDMRVPIQYALSYPRRVAGVAGRLDLLAMAKLELREPDPAACPALALGFRVAGTGGTSGAVLSAANEEAVAAFLDGRIRFTDIVPLVEEVLNRHDVVPEPDVETVIAADNWAREEAVSCL